jgi:ubiquinone/menaquinone biosynthesis C-methylase UbiE
MKQESLKAYDERYKSVYDLGVKFWNQHEPHPKLLSIAEELPQGARCIDLGCGEGQL